jgi:DNA-binding transcriptional LysR family regulator
MIDRLSSMNAFVVATETGSYAGAGRHLGLSPQMVAKHVASLEQRLGARLLNRTTRRQSLTDVGRAYYERCKHILAETQAAESLGQVMNTTPRGKLRISAPVTFGSWGLMPLVTGFLRQHPEVEIDLHLTDRFVDLIEEGYEVAFRIGKVANSTLVARPLKPYRLLVCAAPSYLKTNGVPRTPDDLACHECLGYAYWSRPADSAWVFHERGQLRSVNVDGRLRINESKALLTAAIDGFGILQGPWDFVQPAIAAGDLVPLLTEFEIPGREMHLLYAADRQRAAKLRSFIDAAMEFFGPVSR